MGYQIKKAAVIGSGTMGGGIAALLAGLGIPTLLLDIVPSKLTPAEEEAGLTLEDEEVRNRIVQSGWKAVTRSRPPSVMSEASKHFITLGNLDDDFDKLADVDWIVEVIIENLEIKQGLFERIEKVRREDCIVSTNTSGLPVNAIAEGRSESFQEHFLGTHFFNPPRWLKLLEIIPHEKTLPEVMDFMIRYGEEFLGKGVVICKDTPNFIANRFFSLTNSYSISYALDHGYTIEEVDGITGVLLGRPKTGTFRLLDLVGIDVGAHVSSNLYELIPDDESRETLRHEGSAKMFTTMVERKWFGNKTRVGFSKRVTTEDGKREFWPLNLQTLEHEPPKKPRFEIFSKGREIEDLGERYKWIVSQVDDEEASEETEKLARYIWATTSFAFGYASRRIPEITDDIVSLDRAVKWGFVHEMGPFEIWDALGVEDTLKRLETEGIEVDPWVKEMLGAGCPTFYQYENGNVVGYYDLEKKGYLPLEPDPRILPISTLKAKEEAVLKRNASASLIDMGDGVGLIEFHSKANSLDQDIFDLISHALDVTEDGRFDALVIGNEGTHFSAGANIFVMWMSAQQGLFDQIDQGVRGMHDAVLRMRYFPKPIVAAPFGMTLAGGAEIAMACSKRVAAVETFIGLVEVGIGVIPGGTGNKEMLRRVVNPVMRIANADPISAVGKVVELIGTAKVATGAYEAFEYGFFQPGDRIIMNKDHLLAEAKRSALAMVLEGYKPPAQEMIYAAGREVLAAIRGMVWDLRSRGWATEHDAVVTNKLGWVLCGGDITEPAWVPEQYILDLERQAFVDLCKEEKTQERMAYMLEHNRPLRN
ncbi:MAG: 3-hydroxyacyl-CoA dehydrogenase/enoyl-CoA hydratase family protein [Anaerolineaceae bacterium]|nr:MAG: 3-hydroxyacyl-CoA dehydrogenase/enoyl-CoA hydratase family protein [Anaerolineaceae bacterium]